MLRNIVELIFWKIALLAKQCNDENIQKYNMTKYLKIY